MAQTTTKNFLEYGMKLIQSQELGAKQSTYKQPQAMEGHLLPHHGAKRVQCQEDEPGLSTSNTCRGQLGKVIYYSATSHSLIVSS